MAAVLYPSSITCTINRPLDDKTNVFTLVERDTIPLAQRYKGMALVVQNSGTTRPQIFWLPTEDLTNNGWEEIKTDSSNVLVPDWDINIDYIQSQIIINDGILYLCNTAHTSSALFEDDRNNWIAIAGGSKSYVHKQTMASDTWLIQHNLNIENKAINILAIDTMGEQIVGYIDVASSTKNLLVYKFGEALTGEAHIK